MGIKELSKPKILVVGAGRCLGKTEMIHRLLADTKLEVVDMNVDTGKLYENMEDGVLEAMKENLSTRREAEALMMPLEDREYEQLTGMNRAQRRQWARDHKKDRK